MYGVMHVAVTNCWYRNTTAAALPERRSDNAMLKQETYPKAKVLHPEIGFHAQCRRVQGQPRLYSYSSSSESGINIEGSATSLSFREIPIPGSASSEVDSLYECSVQVPLFIVGPFHEDATRTQKHVSFSRQFIPGGGHVSMGGGFSIAMYVLTNEKRSVRMPANIPNKRPPIP